MIDVLKGLIRQFMPFAQEKMGFSRPPRLFLRQDEKNAANPLGKTGFYDPQAESITLYTTGRHPKDIMRSLAHELQHHTQKCNGDFESVQNMGEEGYAQTNPHMRNMEIQAYQASIVFRDWEDSTKGTIYYEHLQKGDKSSMSTKNWKNGELKSLLAESWGFKADLSKLNEKADKNTGMSGVKGDDDDDTYMGHIKEDSGEEEAEEEEALEEGHDKDWGMGKDEESRTRPGEEDYTGHKGDESHTHPGEEDYEGGDEKPEDLAHELLALAHRMGDALGVESSVSTGVDEEEEELDERRARGRKGPSTRQDDPRLRESVAKMHRAGYSNKQIKKFLTEAYRKASRS